MRTTTIDITQKEPVLFRVEQVTSNPWPSLSPSSDVLLHIEILNPNRQRVHGMPMDWYRPHRPAVEAALASQHVFWVDLDYSKTPTFPPRDDDTVTHRLLCAMSNEQRVTKDPERERSRDPQWASDERGGGPECVPW